MNNYTIITIASISIGFALLATAASIYLRTFGGWFGL